MLNGDDFWHSSSWWKSRWQRNAKKAENVRQPAVLELKFCMMVLKITLAGWWTINNFNHPRMNTSPTFHWWFSATIKYVHQLRWYQSDLIHGWELLRITLKPSTESSRSLSVQPETIRFFSWFHSNVCAYQHVSTIGQDLTSPYPILSSHALRGVFAVLLLSKWVGRLKQIVNFGNTYLIWRFPAPYQMHSRCFRANFGIPSRRKGDVVLMITLTGESHLWAACLPRLWVHDGRLPQDFSCVWSLNSSSLNISLLINSARIEKAVQIAATWNLLQTVWFHYAFFRAPGTSTWTKWKKNRKYCLVDI